MTNRREFIARAASLIAASPFASIEIPESRSVIESDSRHEQREDIFDKYVTQLGIYTYGGLLAEFRDENFMRRLELASPFSVPEEMKDYFRRFWFDIFVYHLVNRGILVDLKFLRKELKILFFEQKIESFLASQSR